MSASVYTASTFRRLIAHAIDNLIGAVFAFPIWIQIGGSWSKHGQIVLSPLLVVACFLVIFFYHWIFLYFFGRTVGKFLLGLQVISSRDPALFENAIPGPLEFMQAGVRVLAEQLSWIFGWAPQCLALFRHDRRHLADWLAETRVVQMSPGPNYFPRRWFLAPLLILYFSCTGFYQVYEMVQVTEISGGKLIIYATR